jgi:hypothetical protein
MSKMLNTIFSASVAISALFVASAADATGHGGRTGTTGFPGGGIHIPTGGPTSTHPGSPGGGTGSPGDGPIPRQIVAGSYCVTDAGRFVLARPRPVGAPCTVQWQDDLISGQVTQ